MTALVATLFTEMFLMIFENFEASASICFLFKLLARPLVLQRRADFLVDCSVRSIASTSVRMLLSIGGLVPASQLSWIFLIASLISELENSCSCSAKDFDLEDFSELSPSELSSPSEPSPSELSPSELSSPSPFSPDWLSWFSSIYFLRSS